MGSTITEFENQISWSLDLNLIKKTLDSSHSLYCSDLSNRKGTNEALFL